MSIQSFFRILPAALLTAALAHATNVSVTYADENVMQKKVISATRYFEQVWAQLFASRGARYSSPQIVAYTDSIRTACGVMGKDNAFYCGGDKKIYYDIVFLTTMMKSAGAYLGTDGDYAPITVLAHEWGHAVQDQLDSASLIGALKGKVTIKGEILSTGSRWDAQS